jgi:hypothetical protein
MAPNHVLPSSTASGRGGFTLLGALGSVALLAAAVAVCVPLVIKRLGTHTPAADDAARRVEAAVTRGLASVGAMADGYGGGLPGLPALPEAGGEPVAAAVPDWPVRASPSSSDLGDGPVNPILFPSPWRRPPLFWRPLFPRPIRWYFYRRPLWRAGDWRRK